MLGLLRLRENRMYILRSGRRRRPQAYSKFLHLYRLHTHDIQQKITSRLFIFLFKNSLPKWLLIQRPWSRLPHDWDLRKPPRACFPAILTEIYTLVRVSSFAFSLTCTLTPVSRSRQCCYDVLPNTAQMPFVEVYVSRGTPCHQKARHSQDRAK